MSKPGLLSPERDLYKFVRETPILLAILLIPLAPAAVFSAWIKSLESPVLVTPCRKSRISSSVSECVSFGTPNETHLELPQLSVEQFLAQLRFENRSKLEELSLTLE